MIVTTSRNSRTAEADCAISMSRDFLAWNREARESFEQVIEEAQQTIRDGQRLSERVILGRDSATVPDRDRTEAE